ncbi:MAG: hypothetical protein RSA08_02970 [Clostridia bacterium]
MKKLITTFIICFFTIFLVFILWSNPRVSNQIFVFFDNFASSIKMDKNIKYDNNFITNELSTMSSCFYFEKLNENQKKIYTDVIKGISKLKENIMIKNYLYKNDDELMKDTSVAIEAILADHPEIFYINNEYSVSTIETLTKTIAEVRISYTVKNEIELAEQINQIKHEIKEIIDPITSTEEFDIELQIHDEILNKIEYYNHKKIEDIPQSCHNIYGAFVNKKAVCDGYSKAFKILLNMKKIDNIIVTGKLDEEPHAWNMVKIKEKWYNTDLTSDNSIKTNEKVSIHAYFNVTTAEIAKTHFISNQENLPIANETIYNYYEYLNKKITAFDDFGQKFEEIINKNTSDKVLELKASGNNVVPESMIKVLKDFKHPEYLSKNDKKFNYYNILDVYIIFKK